MYTSKYLREVCENRRAIIGLFYLKDVLLGFSAAAISARFQMENQEETSDDHGASIEPSFSVPSLFAAGDKVFAYHGPSLYVAKVQKIEFGTEGWKYFVHYLGWSKTWDEWVGNGRLLKYNEENRRTQHILAENETVKNQKAGSPTRALPSPDTKNDQEHLMNLATEGVYHGEIDTMSGEPFIKIQIPEVLKKQLVDDCEFVTKRDKLVDLPRYPNVDDIFSKYLEHSAKKDGVATDSTEEILKGLRCYFNKVLPVMLLYKKERPQYNDFIIDDAVPSAIYGAEHLLRLFVKLPELLAFVRMEEKTLICLQEQLHDILRFLERNQSCFFLTTYDQKK